MKISKIEKLLSILWGDYCANTENVSARFNKFTAGNINLRDKHTGEIYKPKDFRCKNRPLKVNIITVWRSPQYC